MGSLQRGRCHFCPNNKLGIIKINVPCGGSFLGPTPNPGDWISVVSVQCQRRRRLHGTETTLIQSHKLCEPNLHCHWDGMRPFTKNVLVWASSLRRRGGQIGIRLGQGSSCSRKARKAMGSVGSMPGRQLLSWPAIRTHFVPDELARMRGQGGEDVLMIWMILRFRGNLSAAQGNSPILHDHVLDGWCPLSMRMAHHWTNIGDSTSPYSGLTTSCLRRNHAHCNSYI